MPSNIVRNDSRKASLRRRASRSNKTMMFKKLLSVIVFAVLFQIAAAQTVEWRQRLLPKEIEELTAIESGTGTSGVGGIQTRILKGDPNRAGLYTIQLTVPANTKIEAHTHPDDRVATVISGTWYFGYGSQFDEKQLKALAPGSFYTEPPNVAHFARTGSEPVVIQIFGDGPSGTEYVKLKKD